MIIVNKQTLEVTTPEKIRADENFSHIMWDFADPEIVSEVLDSVGLAIVNMPDQPMFDAKYQTAEVTNISETDGVYSGEWELRTVDLPIEELAAIKAGEITFACETAITSGFYSEALGGSYFYSCDIPAQLNIQANLLAASVGRTDIRHICTDVNGVREIHSHTPEQMIAVGESMGLHIWSQLEKANTLRIALAEALANNDAESLIAISW